MSRRKSRPTAQSGARDHLVRIYGRHAVIAALDNPRRRCIRLLHDRQLDPALRERAAVRTEQVASAVLDREAGDGAVHQGLVLLAEPLAPLALEEIPAGGLVLALDQVTDPRNVGACFRAAAAFSAVAILTQDRHAPNESGALARAAAGGLDLVPWCRVTNLARALDHLANAGYWRVGLSGEAGRLLNGVKPGGAHVLVMGSEDKGMRRLTAEHCDELVRIPMDPRMESLNVATAAAIALHHFMA